MYSKQSKRRRAFVTSVLGSDFRVLEFGPLDNPTFHVDLGDRVEYLDYFSAEELREALADNPRRKSSRIVPVHHVVKSKHFARTLDGPFDLLVANHVLEHVPDPIAWLHEAQSVLADGGWVFMALPDRRWTFDFHRPVTVASSMVRAHDEDLEKPSEWQVLEAMYYWTKVDSNALWAGGDPPPFRPRFTLDQAREMAEQRSQTYADVHCWVFTMESFQRCIADLHSGGMVDFVVDLVRAPAHGTKEFFVVLRKDPDRSDDGPSRT